MEHLRSLFYQVNQSVNCKGSKPCHSAGTTSGTACSLLAGLYHSVRLTGVIQRFSAGHPLATAGVLIRMAQSYKEQGSVESLPALLDEQVCFVNNYIIVHVDWQLITMLI